MVANISINPQQIGMLLHLVLDKIDRRYGNQSRTVILNGEGRCSTTRNALVQDAVFWQVLADYGDVLDSLGRHRGCNNVCYHKKYDLFISSDFTRIFSVCEISFYKGISSPAQKICDCRPKTRTAYNAALIVLYHIFYGREKNPFL